MQKRRRFKQTTSFEKRLSEFASGERAKADSMMPESMDKYELLKKLKQAETAANIDVWASAGLQPGRPRSGRVHER